MTSHPASVSIGDPQLPSCMTSQERAGARRGTDASQYSTSSLNAMWFVSKSGRVRATNRPPTVRGKIARPLPRAAGPEMGKVRKAVKSSVWMPCWAMSRPSNAV